MELTVMKQQSCESWGKPRLPLGHVHLEGLRGCQPPAECFIYDAHCRNCEGYWSPMKHDQRSLRREGYDQDTYGCASCGDN